MTVSAACTALAFVPTSASLRASGVAHHDAPLQASGHTRVPPDAAWRGRQNAGRPAAGGTQADCARAPLPDAAVAPIRAAIAASGAEVAVVMSGGCRELRINPDLRMHAASTMKLPVMIELFRQVDAGTRSLDDTIPVSNTFRSMIDGSPFTLNAADDSDQQTYTRVGQRITLRDACERMITVSSNLTTNLLIDTLGIDRIRATVTALGAEGMDVRRKVEDGPAFRAGQNNTTTAAGLATLLEAIRDGKAASQASTREMIAMLERQAFNDGIPAGLPPGTAVAHKTGTITKIHHDAGIVYAEVPFVLVVMTRGIETEKASDALIADITRRIYQAMRIRE
jgi:beta-lactamase class A